MSFAQRIARRCLRRPARLYDLFAIVLVSAGINVLTGAGGTQHEALAVLSGISLAGAGALLTYVKNRCDNIARSVESSVSAESEAIARTLRGSVDDKISGTLPSSEVAMIEPRSTPEHLEDALKGYLSRSGTDRMVALQCIGLIVFTVIGVIGAFCTLYATDNADQRKAPEDAASAGSQRVVLEIAQIRSELAALNADQRRAIEDAASAGNQRVVLEIGQIRSELAALNADQRRAIEDAASAGNQKLLVEIEQIKNELATLSRAVSDQNRAGDRGSTIVPLPEPAKN